MKPHILFFDEQYSEEYYKKASLNKAAEQSDCLILIGCSVQSARDQKFVVQFLNREVSVIELNPEPYVPVGLVFQVCEKPESAVPNIFKEFYLQHKGPKMK